ncbi:hypothetical protein N0V82_007299 [Gnomoniopsis sp. IMI 355080]|nr:hypothetical protein N0V82_007299 [Gnomoniopsis sp. IMI 355080]
MPRIPCAELRSYLLSGQLHHQAQHQIHSAPFCPRVHRRHFSPSVCQSQQHQTITPQLDHVPLRKQLKASAKAHKKLPHSRRQTIPGWELTVGIEIHAQLNSRHKLFSPAAPPQPSDDPNSRVALFDLATPGSQPLFQHDALLPALRAALALNCQIQRVSRWDRKHYFWWDQPGGYQITQFYEPFARAGFITLAARDGIADEDGESLRVGIRNIQMEQDTAKTLARPDGVQWVDFNRVGVPLIEIITEPEIHHPKTAAALVRKIQTYLNSVDACVSGMEAGGLRADVNVSVRRTDGLLGKSTPLGQRTEIKNLSSFKAVEDAIFAERDRQIAVLEDGGTILSETRGWSIGGTETTRLRGKEGEVDYRYMPDPDLAPLHISEEVVSHLRENMGMLPDAEVDELMSEYGLKTHDAIALIQLDDGGRIEYFYDVVQRLQSRLGPEWKQECAVLAGNWILHELGRLTSEKNASADRDVDDLGMTPTGDCARVPSVHLADIIYFLYQKRIGSGTAKELLFAIYRGDLGASSSNGYPSVEEAIESEGLWSKQLSPQDYEDLASQALEDEETTLKKHFQPFFAGKSKKYPEGQLMRFVGKMMRNGPSESIDPKAAVQVLRDVIEKRMQASKD